MLGWTGRGLQAGEATLAHWRPLQAALPARWPLTPDTQPGGGRGAGVARTADPLQAGSVCSSLVNPPTAVGN